jgi:hypothetical protein
MRLPDLRALALPTRFLSMSEFRSMSNLPTTSTKQPFIPQSLLTGAPGATGSFFSRRPELPRISCFAARETPLRSLSRLWPASSLSYPDHACTSKGTHRSRNNKCLSETNLGSRISCFEGDSELGPLRELERAKRCGVY